MVHYVSGSKIKIKLNTGVVSCNSSEFNTEIELKALWPERRLINMFF